MIRHPLALLACALCIGLVPSTAFGALTDFVIDPTQSYLTMTGTTNLFTKTSLTEQYPGSLTTALYGDIYANIGNLSAISVDPSSSISLALQPNPVLPGNISAQLAGKLINWPPGVTTTEALYNIQFPFAASTMSASGGILNTSQLHIANPVHILVAVDAPTFYTDPAVSVSMGCLFNNGTYQTLGSGAKIVIPIHGAFSDVTLEQTFSFTGQVVAQAVPEPSTLALAAIGAIALFAAYRSRPTQS